jgi:tRNA nucleotidyltransferase/poly(A) polymerase
MMETRLTPDQQKFATQLQEVARAQQVNLYLTGGTIRDLISGFPIRELEFVVQGNALKLQKELEKLGAIIEGTDDDYRIAYVVKGNVRAQIESALSATYDKPGKPPKLTPGTIVEDLRRRDFTINAMALSLNEGSRGLLSDPFNGVADIEAKLIRVLHSYAFLEEPIRLIRVTRLAARFHWQSEERTQARYNAAKENNYIEYLDGRAIGHELEALAHEDDPLHILAVLEKEGWLKVLNPHWSVPKMDTAGLKDLMKIRAELADVGINADSSAAVMYYLTRKLSDADVRDMQKHIPRKHFVQAWKSLHDEANALAKKLSGKESATPSRTWQVLTQAQPEALLFLAATARQQAVDQKIKNFFGKWRQLRQKLPLPEMAELNITPALPVYPKVEQEAFYLLLDGKLRSRTEIMKFLKPYEPPPPPPPPPAKKSKAVRAAEAAAAAAAAAAKAAAAAAAPVGKAGKKGRKGAPAAAPVVAPAPAAKAAKPAAKTAKVEAKPVAKKVEAKPVAKKVEARPAVKKAEAKPAAKKAGSKPAVKKPSKPVKPASKKPAPKKLSKPAKRSKKK